MKRNISTFIALLLTASLILTVNPSFTEAWDQGPAYETHQEINKYALQLFFTNCENNAKYANSPIYKTPSYLGPFTTSYSLRESGYEVEVKSLTFEEWVMHGGYSADEPHLWASVRHFYDPLARDGHHELTDHESVHAGFFGYTAMSAYGWAIEEQTNPFSWYKALDFYKHAMEVPEEGGVPPAITGLSFRDLTLNPATPAKAREAYLGKAFRSLGETMHMVADLTQPCHVRNDSHPTGDVDPVEGAVTKNYVQRYARSWVDPESKVGTSPNLKELYENLALYTNANFYSDGTIADASGVAPKNGEEPMPQPQFSQMKWDKNLATYYKYFKGKPDNKPVPMIRRQYSCDRAGDQKKTYVIPPSFSDNQSEILLPIAVKANSRVIDFFFPTMILTAGAKQDASMSSDSTKVFLISGNMEHQVEDDPEWQRNNLEIKYSGPAELWRQRNNDAIHLQDVKFRDGLLTGKPMVYVGEAPGNFADDKISESQVEDGDSVYLVIKAGGRRFISNKCLINATITKPEQKPKVAPTTPSTGTGWYLDGPPFIKKNDPPATDCGNFGFSMSIADGSATGSRSWKDCSTDKSKCGGTYTGTVTWTPPPSFMKPGSTITFTMSEKQTAQNTCGSLGYSTWGVLKINESTLVNANEVYGTPTDKKSYTVPSGSPGAKMVIRVSMQIVNRVGDVFYSYTYK